MPLSEHEQRMLEQMERALYEEDPRFAATIRNSKAPANGARRGAGLGVLIAALGVITMVTGLVANLPIVSVLGFVALLGGTYTALRGVTREVRVEQAPQEPRPSKFLKNAEERFRNRRDGNPT